MQNYDAMKISPNFNKKNKSKVIYFEDGIRFFCAVFCITLSWVLAKLLRLVIIFGDVINLELLY